MGASRRPDFDPLLQYGAPNGLLVPRMWLWFLLYQTLACHRLAPPQDGGPSLFALIFVYLCISFLERIYTWIVPGLCFPPSGPR